MALKSTIVFILLFASLQSEAQSELLNKRPVADTNTRTYSSPGIISPAENVTPLDVMIATNEDCVLLLNNGEKTPVTKTAFLYLKLAPGLYRFSAKSQTTGDIYIDTFSVATGKLNEVFIDLL